MAHQATCSCGQLKATYHGEITRTSICHCLECQKRTGSAFGVQIRVEANQVTTEGDSTVFRRTGDAGSTAEFHFCPRCGSTVYWFNDSLPGSIVISVGSFADPTLPSPTFMVYGNRKHHWLVMPGTAIEYFD